VTDDPLQDRRAYVVDDEAGMRTVIRRILTAAGIYTEEFESAEALLEGYSARPIGCVLLDVRLPGMSGLELLKQIRRQPPPNPIIILSGFADIAMAVEAVSSGALDVLQKPFRKQQLLDAVTKAYRAMPAIAAAGEEIVPLTPREREVLQACSDGAPTKVVAFRLGLSTRTVEMHRSTIVKKLGVLNMTQALLIAKERRLIS
jgi:two-component system, LuxR family, response regulator FixJ